MLRRGRGPERVLATLLFTDMVGSTEIAARLGDRSWKAFLARHNSIVRRELKRFGGRELDTAGDGFFALFDRPAQAIECASAAVEALSSADIPIRAAVHMGEVEVIGDKVGGIAVHAAARVLGQAGQGEILVTAIAHDLVAGSEIRFTDRGVTELRGVPGQWHLYVVERAIREAAQGPAEDVPQAASSRRRRTLTLALVGGAGVLAVGGILVWQLASGRPAPTLEAAPNTVVNLGPANDGLRALAEIDDPTEMVFGQGALWVLSFSGRNLIRVDPSSAETRPIGLPATPTGLAVAEEAIWITTGFGAASGEAGIVRVGVSSLRVEGTIPLGAGVEGIAAGESALWVTNRLRNTLTRIDLNTQLVSGVMDVGEQPEAVIVGEGSVWVLNALDRTVWRIDPGSMVRTAEVTLSDVPYDLALGFGRLWVTSSLGNSVSVIDVATMGLQRTLDVSGTPRGVAAGSESVWVALGGAAALRIDPNDLDTFHDYQLAGASHDVVAVGKDAWVSIRE